VQGRVPAPLLIAALALFALPPLMLAIGLTMTAATEVVVFAMACMALNILVGYTGLVSFGHGAWFGLAAYAAGLLQRNLMPGSFFGATLAAMFIVAAVAAAFGSLVLRRRGVYFSLLTLALSAMLYSASFRWTDVTGGENGLGGITRPAFAGVDLESSATYYWFVSLIAFVVVVFLWRFHNSTVGSVLVAIRENEQRARFLGYRVSRYKLAAFVLSAAITGLAGILLLYKNRMTSADPISVAFSGELLAMVVIGGMRSFLGPALGAFFFILFRELLSTYTENWLLWFGLVFVGFIVFSPSGLVGVGERLLVPFRKKTYEDAAMAARRIELLPLPEFLQPRAPANGPVLAAAHIEKSFGGIHAVRSMDLRVADRTLHALIGPNGAGKTTAFNVLSGMYPPDKGNVTLMGLPIAGKSPEAITAAGIGRSFQITNLFPALSVFENIRLAVQARHPRRANPVVDALSISDIDAHTQAIIRYVGLAGIEKVEAGALSYGGQRLLDMGLALATAPRILLLDEPLAGLSAAERERIGAIIKRISADLPILLVEHDIDRVFQLADHVTVMNDGSVLLDGTTADARDSTEVQKVYIGSGAATIIARARESSAMAEPLLDVEHVNTFYGKSHVLKDVSFSLHQKEIVALLGRNGAGKSTLLKTLIGITPPASGSIILGEHELVGRKSAPIAQLGIGYVPQGRGLFSGMSVKENLDLGALKRQTGHGVHWTRERIYEYFPRIRERLNSPADYLSGGEQQMVSVARALSGDVRVLLLDEPFEGLAPTVIEQLFETFDRLRHEVGIVIVDHHLDLALALSDRTIALERGEVIHEGPSAALRNDLALRRKVLWL
jgi:ABC-type branched-subunit amino acid transport system ATPase component/ABC-type branched-subunit amino acid transport system permease subunit